MQRLGEVLDFSAEKGRLVAVKRAARHPVVRVYGILKLGRRADELIDELRGKPDAV